LKWRIVASGPSADWDSLMWADWEETDYVMCINQGIVGALFCHYWCCIDKPNAVHTECIEDYHRLLPRLLTKKKRFPHFNALLGPDVRLENLYAKIADKPSWVLEAQTGSTYSIMAGTAYAVAMGATEIHYYGVDLKGAGYKNGNNPKETPKEAWKLRWPKEIGVMRKLYQASLKNGVALHGLPLVVTNESKASKK